MKIRGRYWKCWLMGHVWETIMARNSRGYSEWLRCTRCGLVPAFPDGGYELCVDAHFKAILRGEAA